MFKAAADGVEPWLNLSDAAHVLKIASKTLRLAAEAGEIDARHPLSDGLGSSRAPNSSRTPPNRLQNAPTETRGAPRDQTKTSKAYSTQ